MAFGLIIDVPLLAGVFGFLIGWRHRFLRAATKIKLPRILLALLVAVPLLTFEEHINCGAYGCTKALLPPTIWFLLAEMLAFFLLYRGLRITKIGWQLAMYVISGVLFELFVGAARSDLRELASVRPLVFALLLLWVGFSYLFVVYLPLLVINYRQDLNSVNNNNK